MGSPPSTSGAAVELKTLQSLLGIEKADDLWQVLMLQFAK